MNQHTPMRALGSEHGDMIRIKVSLSHDDFTTVSQMAYVENVPVSVMLRKLVQAQLKQVAA